MNYIKHLSAFFDMILDDERLNPSHISLYMALFQFWNINHFENPISISRSQTMGLCKIGSYHTYHKCLNDLHMFGYISYTPSHNPLKGSLVNMCIFDTSSAQVKANTCANSEQVLHQFSGKIETSSEQVMHPSINYINVLNNKTCGEQTQNENQNLNLKKMKEVNSPAEQSKKKCTEEKKVKVKTENPAESEKKFIKPPLDEIKVFFKTEDYPEIEARKFFNHFESNGWKVGGKSPMKNWQAAARNWMLNSQRYITPKGFPKPPQPKQKPDPNNKNYSEPL